MTTGKGKFPQGNVGPRNPIQYPAEGIQAPIIQANTQISFSNPAFINALRAHGVVFEHFRALPDPTGMASKGDNHAVMTGHVRSNSDGYLYEKIGEFRAFFQANSTSTTHVPEGDIAFSSAYITLPEFYEDLPAEPLLVAPFDRLYIKNIETRVIHRQFVEATQIGVDKLQYPATCVEWVRDANGVMYSEGTDFQITTDGRIQWLTQKRPGWNSKVGRGTVYAIRFRYTAFFVIARLMHEIRVFNVTDLGSGTRNTVRAPYQVMVMRENVFYDVNIDPLRNLPPDERFEEAPSPGGNMGPNPGGVFGGKGGAPVPQTPTGIIGD